MHFKLLFQSAFVLTTFVHQSVGAITVQAEKLVDFNGCGKTTIEPDAIRKAWDSAMDLAYVVSGNIEWGHHPSIDFLAGPTRNKDHQHIIKAVLNNAWTFRRRYWWNPPNWTAWKTSIRCDDIDGACGRNGGAPAYTINPGKRPGHKFVATRDTIVICPTFNTTRTCEQGLKYPNTPAQKIDLSYYRCRGYAMLHEMFHLDSLSKISTGGHIKDLGVLYQGNSRRVAAYGPAATKVLALWPKDDVGEFVVTNADNLAHYALAAWVAYKNSLYPSLPPADGVPNTDDNPRLLAELEDPVVPVVAAASIAIETYVDCNNNNNIEWATAPFVSQAFAQSSITTFCNSVQKQSTATFPVPSTADTVLFLGAVLQVDNPTCTTLTVSSSECTSQLGKILSGCDANSASRKYGGVSTAGCVTWAVVVDGTRSAVKDLAVPFSCSLLVTDATLQCACTNGELYPLKDESCGYTSAPDPTSSSGQQIAVASYTNPLGDPTAWQRLISYESNKLSILVANVLNGPDYVVDLSWAAVIQQAARAGKTVIGYVRTGYLGVSLQQFKTRLGSGDLADWASQIEQDVDKWFELYPGNIGGIFFDEGWPECGPNNIYSNLYAHINAYTKRKHPGAYTVLNPGSTIAQCYEDTMDTLLTFESSYETYTSSAFVENTWKPKDNRKIWHIIYRVPQDKIAEVAALSLKRNVGYLEVTDDDNPNPYDNVPSEAYMQAAMGAVSGGKVRKDAAVALGGSYIAGVPSDAKVTASDYTSVTITWSPVANALGYAVYQNGVLVLEIPASLTRATVGMLKPGTSGISFEIRTVLSSGSGGVSRTVTASTNSLPSSGSITNVKYTKSGANVIYTANILVPYAFVRLFIGGPHKAVGASAGWPIDADLSTDNGGGDPVGVYKLVNYLVEGNDFYSGFYKYSGAYVEAGTANADWTWSPQGTAPQTQSGYTLTWNVPLGGTDALPDDYVIQGQGYAPIQNIFGGTLRSYRCAGKPCDSNPDYNCKGSSLCSLPNLLKWCDLAVNNLTRTDSLTYTTADGGTNGNCHGDGAGACGVFLQGTGCAMSGNDMWNTYQDLRDLGGCSKCGSFHQTNGCLLTVNYVSKCNDGGQQGGGAPF